jgi:hypothetical protein
MEALQAALAEIKQLRALLTISEKLREEVEVERLRKHALYLEWRNVAFHFKAGRGGWVLAAADIVTNL